MKIRILPLLFIILTCQQDILLSQSSIDSNKIETILSQAVLPGISLCSFDEDQFQTFTYGYRSVDTRLEITENTVFSAASLSKPLFAIIVLQLVGEYKIDLDRPLYHYFDYEDISHDERHEKVTARMVLSHQSGLPNWRRGELNFRYDPGEKFSYSGEGFVWLQKTIEHITGESLEELAKKRIFQPMGMTRTSYILGDQLSDDYAIPHNDVLKTSRKFFPEDPNAAHSLQTTASDYAKFLSGVSAYQLIPEASFKELVKPQVEVKIDESTGDKIEWGLGFGLQTTKDGTELWHWGDNGTFKAYFTVSKNLKNGMVYFCNGSNGLSMTQEIADETIGTKQPSVDWNGYAHFNSPAFKAVQAIMTKPYRDALSPYMTPDGLPDSTLFSPWQLDRLASRLLSFKRYDEAEHAYQDNIKLYPKSSRAHRNLGNLYLEKGNKEGALIYYKKAYELGNEDKTAMKIANQLESPSKGKIEFKLPDYNNARSVSLIGDFNDWNDKASLMSWEDGYWVVSLDIAKGDFDYNYSVDGITILDPVNSESRFINKRHYSVLVVDEKGNRVSSSLEDEKMKILELHHAQRDFHFNKDSIAFARLLSDDIIQISDGEISRSSYEENLKRFGQYFRSVEFIKWDDVSEPVIELSSDGNTAYTVVDKEVVLLYMDKNGDQVQSRTEYAWLAIYQKEDGEWRVSCVASTNKPSEILD